MSDEIFKIIFEEFKKNGVKLNDYDLSVDTFVADPLDPRNVTNHFFRGDEIPPLLDFSEHDKVFEDKIAELEGEIASLKSHMSRLRERCMDGARRNFDRGNYGCLTILNRNGDLETESEKLKQRIAELESKETSDLPFDPLETANYLINATYERETSSLERGLKGLPEKVNSDRYTVDELEQIAEHLLVYCKHNKEGEE